MLVTNSQSVNINENTRARLDNLVSEFRREKGRCLNRDRVGTRIRVILKISFGYKYYFQSFNLFRNTAKNLLNEYFCWLDDRRGAIKPKVFSTQQQLNEERHLCVFRGH